MSKINTKTHDAVQGKKNIQIKMTQGDSVDISKVPDYLLVLKIVINSDTIEAYEVYNGPGSVIQNEKENSNGWKTVAIRKLSHWNVNVMEKDRIKTRENVIIKKWEDKQKT